MTTSVPEVPKVPEVQVPKPWPSPAGRALFERIGTVRVRSATATAYETEAARRVGEQVLRELIAARKAPR